jgi:hypothetical protein
MQLDQNGSLIVRLTVLKNSLNYTAAVWMSRKTMNLSPESFDDELNMWTWDTFNRLLHNMVAILVFNTLHDIGLEFLDELSLLIGEDMFESLLDDPAAVHL